jgi:hypothetical protein
MHRYRDGDGAKGLGIKTGGVPGPGRCLDHGGSAVKAEKQSDEKRHDGKKQEHQPHPEHGELYSRIE